MNYEELANEVEATDKPLADFYRSLAKGTKSQKLSTVTGDEQQRYKEFILHLYLARRHKHLTQVELAERAGIPQSSLARIEAGRVNPSLKTLLKIADALEVQLLLRPKR